MRCSAPLARAFKLALAAHACLRALVLRCARDTIIESKVHLQNVEAADVAVDGVDDLALVDEHVVELDGAGGRHRRRPRHEQAAPLAVGTGGGVLRAAAPRGSRGRAKTSRI